MKVPRDNVRGMRDLAAAYARELDAQLRTLNLFADHAGEIGRAHEYFLRSVLARFLPSQLHVGTGFASNAAWTSSQQDVLIYAHALRPLLFQVGDCVVADDEAVRAMIEVKTCLDSGDLTKYLDALPGIEEHSRGAAKFLGLFAWEGLSLDTTLERIWEFVRVAPSKRRCQLPDAIYVRGKFLLLDRSEGEWWGPMRVMRLGGPGSPSEGDALLALLGTMWYRLQYAGAAWPFWLESWPGDSKRLDVINWPADLQATIQALLPWAPGAGVRTGP